MSTQPVEQDENGEYYYGIPLPFDGFINVNAILSKKRDLQNAVFTDQMIQQTAVEQVNKNPDHQEF